jgi:hypothetical protein
VWVGYSGRGGAAYGPSVVMNECTLALAVVWMLLITWKFFNIYFLIHNALCCFWICNFWGSSVHISYSSLLYPQLDMRRLIGAQSTLGLSLNYEWTSQSLCYYV